ncbi:MAG: phosphonate ABC transporter, permease protein PhnE [Acidobacteria bacterium]|nr:phosphonate ABC transporter, permease protein PhnE [Acidobacteriota bacterium]
MSGAGRGGRLAPALLPLATLALLVVVLGRLGLFDGARLSRGARNLVEFLRGTVPPDTGILPVAAGALVESIEMAFAGSLLGFALALPLGLLGTRTLFPLPVVVAVRVLVGAVRTIPSLLWAVIFVVVVGLGPLAGTLALAVYTVGFLGKLYAEFFDGVDPEVLEAVRGVGARRWHLARFVVWPESANQVLSQLVFMFEYNVRASAIVGLVGAGGIGFYLNAYINTLNYPRVATILLMILGLVLLMDVVSTRVRQRYLLRG